MVKTRLPNMRVTAILAGLTAFAAAMAVPTLAVPADGPLGSGERK